MVAKTQQKAIRRGRRKMRLRKRVFGTAERPRLSIFRSVNHTYAQLIDDAASRTVAMAGTLDPALKGALKGTGNRAAAEAVGTLVAERAIKAGVKKIVFDRNGFIYHGRVQALADAARKAGLEF